MSAILDDIKAVLRPELDVTASPIRLEELQEPDRPPILLKWKERQKALVISFEHCLKALNKSDLPGWIFPLFQPNQNIRKSCDYVIFCEVHDGIFVLLVELKGRHKEQAEDQIANTRLLVDWILDLASFKSTGHFRGDTRGPARYYRSVIFQIGASYRHGHTGIPYLVHPKMSDLKITSLPYGPYLLQDFWVDVI